MSERTIDELTNNEPISPGYIEDDLNTKEYYAPAPNNNEKILEILRTPTGEGSIDDYVIHPLNFNQSKGLAQILRGLTGIVGDLKFAVVDIVIGTLRFSRERKVAGNYDNVYGGGNISS